MDAEADAEYARYDNENSDVYNSYQASISVQMTVSTLLMGFIITGALISLGYAGDATYGQGEAKDFVENGFHAFLYSLLSLALSLILSVVGAQIFNNSYTMPYSAMFFKVCAPILLISEMSIYQCGSEVMQFVDSYVTLNYISPSRELCPGDANGLFGAESDVYIGKSDSFCAQLGEDLYTAASALPECKSMLVPPDPKIYFNLSTFSTATQRKQSICYIQWLYKQQVEMVKPVTKMIWFGYMSWKDDDPASGLGMIAPETIIQNTGRILGDVMCDKDGAQASMVANCGTAAAVATKNGATCAAARTAYYQADACAGGKFDDVMKCFHACSWKNGQSLASNFVFVHDVTETIRILITIWMIIRLLLWCCFNCVTLVSLYRSLSAKLGQRSSYGDFELGHVPMAATYPQGSWRGYD